VLRVKTLYNIGDVDHRALGSALSVKSDQKDERGRRIMTIFIIGKNGERLMPTVRCGRVRHLLQDGKAIIVKHDPFTVQLTYGSNEYVQDIELCIDSGYEHAGVSMKSDAREYVSAQYDMLSDEKQRHDDQRRYRRTRRNRKRYRKPRFDNRNKPKGWLAPSIQHKKETQVRLIERFVSVAPVTSIIVEVGQFDPAVLKAIEEGTSIPEGTDYQRGERYRFATLREAVFQRDGYKCCFCGRGIKENAILYAHHALYWKGRHADRVRELAACCERCHTAANHHRGGKLWGYEPKVSKLEGASFMNAVRWAIINELKAKFSGYVHFTYGVTTKLKRQTLRIEKSHINDAYAMGNKHPEKRASFEHYVKRRRNNRCLELFYDAKYIDLRDGKTKAGKSLGCERTNRREPRNNEKSLRKYRGQKISKGRRSIRKTHYTIQPGTLLSINNEQYVAKGCHCNGKSVMLTNGKSVTVSKARVLKYASGWMQKNITKGCAIPPTFYEVGLLAQ